MTHSSDIQKDWNGNLGITREYVWREEWRQGNVRSSQRNQKQREIKIKTSESKGVRPMKEGGSSEDGVKKVNRLEIPKGVSDMVEERERQIS